MDSFTPVESVFVSPIYLPSHRVLQSRDSKEASDLATKMWERHCVHVRGRDDLETTINSFRLGGLSLSYVDCPTSLLIECESVVNQYYLGFVLEGTVALTVNGQLVPANLHNAAFLSPGTNLRIESQTFRVLMLAFQRDTLAPALTALGQPTENWARSIDLTLPSGRSLFSLCDWAARELDQEGSPLTQPVHFSHLQTTLTGLLLHALSPQFPSDQSQEQWIGIIRMNDMTEWIRENLYRPIHIADLGEKAGVSARAVELAFHQHLGCPPLQFVRRLKLEEARRVLLTDPRRSITSVASSLGYHHLGRFSEFYSREFGESPKQTRQRGRSS